MKSTLLQNATKLLQNAAAEQFFAAIVNSSGNFKSVVVFSTLKNLCTPSFNQILPCNPLCCKMLQICSKMLHFTANRPFLRCGRYPDRFPTQKYPWVPKMVLFSRSATGPLNGASKFYTILRLVVQLSERQTGA